MASKRVRCVDTVVELKSIRGGTNSSNSFSAAIAGGYWAIGDGGGGMFYWDTSSSSGDNGVTSTQPGTIIVPNGSTSGRWVRIYSGPINVRWFGARGEVRTDIDDDEPAISKAIVVASTNHAAVFIPRGVYRLHKELVMSNVEGLRLHGEGMHATFLEKVGPSADTIVFKSSINRCEVAHLCIRPAPDPNKPFPQNSGAAIKFTEPVSNPLLEIGASTLIKLHDLDILAWQGITVEGPGFRRGWLIGTVTMEKVNINYVKTGIKLCYAVNCTLENFILWQLNDFLQPVPQSNIFGVWIDTETEGCVFNNIYSLGGEHCWRIANTVRQGAEDRGPSENRFYSCIGDNGYVSCIYISSLHRGIFTNCWCSYQQRTRPPVRDRDQDAAVVMDDLDIWGVQWVSSQIVNVESHGIKVLAARSFAILNSTFSEWNLNNRGHSAIIIFPDHRTNFTIIGNQFIRDTDFGNHNNVETITVRPGTYNRYIVSDNMSYAGTADFNLGIGSLSTLTRDNSPPANFRKIVNNL